MYFYRNYKKPHFQILQARRARGIMSNRDVAKLARSACQVLRGDRVITMKKCNLSNFSAAIEMSCGYPEGYDPRKIFSDHIFEQNLRSAWYDLLDRCGTSFEEDSITTDMKFICSSQMSLTL